MNKKFTSLLTHCAHFEAQLARARDEHRIYSERNLEIFPGHNRKITIDCTITPVSARAHGKISHILLECIQIDHRIRISREDQLISQEQDSRAFLRGIAHEIKNPLGGIRGAAQLLASELPDPQYTEYTDVIRHEVDRLQKLLDQMSGTRQLPEFVPHNIHESLEQVRKLIVAESDSAVLITTDYDPSLPETCADSQMLQQALLNLARNGLQAVATTDNPRLIFRTRAEHACVIGKTRHRLVLRIEILDNGPGIAARMQEKIFLPMVTSKADGTGLGLSIAQTLIQRHRGLIEYERYEDMTYFIVYLPVETNHGSK